jgi:hypothetical protein
MTGKFRFSLQQFLLLELHRAATSVKLARVGFVWLDDAGGACMNSHQQEGKLLLVSVVGSFQAIHCNKYYYISMKTRPWSC